MDTISSQHPVKNLNQLHLQGFCWNREVTGYQYTSHCFPENQQQRTPQLSPFEGHAFSGTHTDVYSHMYPHSFPCSLLFIWWVSQKHAVRQPLSLLSSFYPEDGAQRLGQCHQAGWGAGIECRHSGKWRGQEAGRGQPTGKNNYFSPLKSTILESAWTQLSRLVGTPSRGIDCPGKRNLPHSVPSWAELTSLHSPVQIHIIWAGNDILLSHPCQPFSCIPLFLELGMWLDTKREHSGFTQKIHFRFLGLKAVFSKTFLSLIMCFQPGGVLDEYTQVLSLSPTGIWAFQSFLMCQPRYLRLLAGRFPSQGHENRNRP